MTIINVYLNFAGNAEEAFKFYRSVFGGEFGSLVRFKDMPMEGVDIPDDEKQKIMHISLPVSKGYTLMASDVLKSMGQELSRGNDVYISIHPDCKEDANKFFKGLSAGGKIEMPIADQPWGDYYGSFTDKFGIQWMVDYIYPKDIKV